MARIDNLNNFLTDVATSIKNKAGLTEITPANFDTAINNISTGLEPQGLLQEYYVAAGKNITPGTFVEFVNGIAGTTTGATPMVNIGPDMGSATASYINSARHYATQLANNKVLLVTNVGRYTGETVVVAVGLTFQNSRVTLTNSIIVGFGEFTGVLAVPYTEDIGAALVGDNGCFVKFTGNTLSVCGAVEDITSGGALLSNLMMRGCICKLDNENVITIGEYESGTYDGYLAVNWSKIAPYQSVYEFDKMDYVRMKDVYNLSTSINVLDVVPSSATSFVILMDKFGSEGGLYAMAGTIDAASESITLGTVYTVSTDAAFNYSSTQEGFGSINTKTGKGLWIRDYQVNSYEDDAGEHYVDYTLKGFLITTSGTTVSTTPVTIDSTVRTDWYYEIYGIQIADDKMFAYWADDLNNIQYGQIFQYGTSVTKGAMVALSSGHSQQRYAHVSKLQSNSLLFSVPKMDGLTAGTLFGKEWFYSGLVLSDSGTISTLETQVQPATSSKVNGIAKNAGTGGSATAHNQKVQVYVPNV